MATAVIEDSDNIECSITITMRLGEWKRVRKTLLSNAAFAELKVINQITNLTNRLESVIQERDVE